MRIFRLAMFASLCATGAMAMAGPQPIDAASQALVETARANLAQRLAVGPAGIALIEFTAVVWPDAAMGCPRPGMVYTQVQREGYRIQFEAGGQRYWYHGGAGRTPFLCAKPSRKHLPPADAPPDRRV